MLDLGSSHLNWLKENGTIGLQNYTNIHKNVISSIVGTLVYQLGYLSLLVHKKCSKLVINRPQTSIIWVLITGLMAFSRIFSVL